MNIDYYSLKFFKTIFIYSPVKIFNMFLFDDKNMLFKK